MAFLCSRNVSKDPVGSICPECGHNSLVHPGANRIDHCAICELVVSFEAMRRVEDD